MNKRMNKTYQPGKAWGITSMLCGLQAVNFVDKVVVGLVAVPMMKELGLTPVQFGIVAGSVFWLFSVGGILGGVLANRVPSRLVLLGMAVVWSLAQIPIALSSSLLVLVIARAVLGFGEGPSAPVALHAAFKWFPNDKRNLPGALINAGSSLGIVLAGLSIPFITAHWGWRTNFWVLAGAGLLWALVWRLFGAEGNLDANAPASDKPANTDKVSYLRLLTDPTVVGAFIMHFVAYWMVAVALAWLPAYLHTGLGFGPQQTGIVFSLTVLLGVPISFAVSGFSQWRLTRGSTSRRGRVLVACLALIVSGALFISLKFLAYSAVQEVIVITLASGIAVATFTLAPALISEVTPASQRSAVLAVDFAVFGSAAGVFAPIVMGWLIEHSSAGTLASYHQGYALSGLLMALGGVFCLLFMNPERSRRKFADLSSNDSEKAATDYAGINESVPAASK